MTKPMIPMEFAKWVSTAMLFLAALVVGGLVGGCAGMNVDKLELVVDVATLRVDRTTSMVQSKAIPVDVAKDRFSFASRAAEALEKAVAVIDTCAAQGGKCDVVRLRNELGAQALEQLEERLARSGDFDKAEAAGAAAIVVRLMTANTSGEGVSLQDAMDTSRLKTLATRFRAAVTRLGTALAG